MRLDVITIFPEYLDPLRHALLGKAIEKGIIDAHVHNRCGPEHYGRQRGGQYCGVFHERG